MVSAAPSGAIFTTVENGASVNANIYDAKEDVYLDGGPGPNAPQHAAGLPDGNYYFQVTDPSGKTLLSTDPVKCREVKVSGGIIVELVSANRTYTSHAKTYNCHLDGKSNATHDTGTDVDHSALTVQLMPFDDTPNNGGVYKAWMTPTGDFQGNSSNVDNSCGTGCFHGFLPSKSKTDNFKVKTRGKFVAPTLNVRKFVDTNGNGVWDSGEPEIGVDRMIDSGGWPVNVTDPNSVVSNGFSPYLYYPGFAGNYSVMEDSVAGWSQTALLVDGASLTVSATAIVTVNYSSGENHTVIYGNFQCFPISGYKVNDLNGNGAWDSGEPGIANWTIKIYQGLTLRATLTTGADGSYSYTACGGGTWTVSETVQSGWTSTGTVSYSFGAQSGVGHTGLNFLNFQQFTVSGHKVNDLNQNGAWDSGEPTVAGWPIQLWRNGALYASTTTAADGSFSFTVTQGGSYEVKEGSVAGWVAVTSTTLSFVAQSGTDHTGLDFLNFHEFTVSGSKVNDLNGDGSWGSGEPTIAGWPIQLWREGVLYASTTTGADGSFSFTVTQAGNYEVREGSLTGWVAVTASTLSFVGVSGTNQTGLNFLNFEEFVVAGSKVNDLNGNGVWNSGEPTISGWPIQLWRNGALYASTTTAADGSFSFTVNQGGSYEVKEGSVAGWVAVTSTTLSFVAQSGTNQTGLNFLNFEEFVVAGNKVNDLNGNGVWNSGEPTIAGWPIQLWRNGALFASTTTAADGSFSFTVNQGGSYEVKEGSVAGWVAVTSTTLSFVAQSGTDHTGLNFLNFEEFVVAGNKVNDLNGNGVWNSGEPTIAGWSIELWRNGALYASTTTAADGSFSFTVNQGGSYEVKEGSLAGWVAVTSTTLSFVAESGTNHTGLNFLNFEKGSICGAKFFDANRDGKWETPEAYLANWTIKVYKDGSLYATTTTDSGGNYCFKDLLWGSYRVVEVIPAASGNEAWVQTLPGGDGGWNITITSGKDATADFGNVCEFTAGLTWGYWKTHTGSGAPKRDAAYDSLPDNPLEIDLKTPDGNYFIDNDSEADWLFGGAGSGKTPNCSGDCRSLVRAQLLATWMNTLAFDGMANATVAGTGTDFDGSTVGDIINATISALEDSTNTDLSNYQTVLNAINNNSEGTNVLNC